MSVEERPTLPELAGVLAAVNAYRGALGLPPGDEQDLRIHLGELKTSIDRVEAVTIERHA